MEPTALCLKSGGLTRVAIVTAIMISVVVTVAAQSPKATLVETLDNEIKLTEAEISGLIQGRVLARILKSEDKREIVGLGMIRINITQEEFLKRYRDIATFKRGPEVLQIGKFGATARIEDIQELTLEQEDLDDLKSCKPGDCKLKLSADLMSKLKEPGTGAESKEKINALFRQYLVDYANDYMKRGNAALTVYNDDKHPFSVSDDFKSLVTDSKLMQAYAPEMVKYLLSFPDGAPPGAENFIYWSKEKFGLKPVVSVTQVVLIPRSIDNRKELLIATKQLFANHYFDSSLGFAVLAQQPSDPKLPGTYMVYLNQSRADAIKGFMTGLRRSVVESKSLAALKNNLKITKERLEKPVPKGKAG